MERLATEHTPVRRTNNDLQPFGWGKIPPQVRDFEEAVLGALMMEDQAINYVGGFLKAEHFYVEAHQWIYTAISNLFIENAPIDILTVSEQLKKLEKLEQVGGRIYVSQLTNKVGSAASIEYHARIIIQKWVMRMLITESTSITQEAYEDSADPLELLRESAERYLSIQQSIVGARVKTMKSMVESLSESLVLKRSLPEDQRNVVGQKSGLDRLDYVTLGWQDDDLIIIAGNTSEGKTTLMMQGALESASEGIPVGIFSLEMPAERLVQKLVSTMSGISVTKIQTGNLNDSENMVVNATLDKLHSYPIEICDTAGLDILEIKAISKLWKLKHNIRQINVDYLQLITVSVDNKRIQTREQEISFISRQLKELAKEIHVPVIALSQLSRANEKRSEKDRRPVKSDLRDGGSIEQDADIIVFVFRPEQHGIKEYPGGRSTSGVTELIVAKNRMGDLKTIFAKFLKDIGKFDASFHNEIKNDAAPDQSDIPSPKPRAQTSSIPEKKDDDLPF